MRRARDGEAALTISASCFQVANSSECGCYMRMVRYVDVSCGLCVEGRTLGEGQDHRTSRRPAAPTASWLVGMFVKEKRLPWRPRSLARSLGSRSSALCRRLAFVSSTLWPSDRFDGQRARQDTADMVGRSEPSLDIREGSIVSISSLLFRLQEVNQQPDTHQMKQRKGWVVNICCLYIRCLSTWMRRLRPPTHLLALLSFTGCRFTNVHQLYFHNFP
jgi:hypothetical protein